MQIIFYSIILIFAALKVDGKEQEEKHQTICLNMIVKDESNVIIRGLETVKPFIDHWVIIDTGSTDGTQEMIKKYLSDIPGTLYERPWKNFGHNRNEALELAKTKADYILFLDADELLAFTPNFSMPKLDKDSYDSIISDGRIQYDRTLLIKDGLDWKWHGVLHEYVGASNAKSRARLEGVTKISRREGNRSADPLKYQKDALVLEEALKEEPNNSRYVFYLAQSYRDSGNYALALTNYQKRALMGGWDQEVFCAMLQAARMQELLNANPADMIKSYYEAYHYRPSRPEPLYYLSKYYRKQNDFASAYLIASVGLTLPPSQDILFVEQSLFDYDMQLEASISAYWIGKYEECQHLSKQILSKTNVPQEITDVVSRNLGFSNKKIIEKYISLTLEKAKKAA